MKKYALFLVCVCLLLLLPSVTFAAREFPILIYHNIDEFKGHGSKELYVSPNNFEMQMLYLRDHGFTLLTFEQWNDAKNIANPIFMTFDDGYKNNLNAFEIFKKIETNQFKPTGTIFVISDFVGRSNRLSKSELKRLADSGYFSIQSHTATHPELTKIKNYQHELKESKEKIERMTGHPIIALAYPYGLYNDKVLEETKKYYSFGLTTIPETFIEKGTKEEKYLLPRLYVKYSTTIEEFAKLVEGR
ncbi:polysaccharide deacetylase family protein [Lederbergia wuyishanensis]|uniref:Peptidoglycan/xylan/chitin deacetylase (PgdA/CDA1 family) n=1 Tax=Lederbergia wuyishanensis TaxID=1347903 RepID=A0ABU0D8C4_9BACI|nr:polysaccharide deacetylase family protein [Lederbergia wuyishanensis]MCJ8009209.1 polysaccharide deacetylase family protein [Lederbergia wuyishanensis]MDQ0344661.1 peptidoglycan/xylan/chitin deacetylase (PgdA/CDA1 family) [Lederbergia wuyishanensis]